MKKIWTTIFDFKWTWLYLILFSMIVYAYINYLTSIFLQTDELLIRSLSNKLSEKQIKYIVSSSHDKVIFTSFLSSLNVPINIIIVSLVITIGTFFMSLKVKFFDIFKVVVIGEIVMVLQEGLKFFWLYFIKHPDSLAELKNFTPLSLQNIFSFHNLQPWQVTLFSISLFDLLFMLILALGLQYRIKDISLEKSFILVVLTYGVALFLLITFKILIMP